MRIISTVNDITIEWTGVAAESMVLLSYRVLTDSGSLMRLSEDFLLTEGEVDDALDAVLAHRASQSAPRHGT